MKLDSILSILIMVVKRIVNNLNLMLASVAGLIITVTLVASIPLYSDGMSEALLHRQLSAPSDQVQPKSSILLRHFEDQPSQASGLTSSSSSSSSSSASGSSSSGSSDSSASGGSSSGSSSSASAPVTTGNVYKPITLDDYNRANKYLTDDAPRVMGIPRKLYVTYGQTDSLPLLQRTDEASLTGREFAGYGFIAFIRDFEKHIKILEGRQANPEPDANGDIEAVMATAGMDEIGLDVGDRIVVVYEKDGNLLPINIHIVGRWYPLNPDDTYWFYQLDYFNNGIMVPESSFFNNIAKPYEGIAHEYAWFMVFDVNAIRSNNVERVL